MKAAIPSQIIEKKIFIIRGRKIILDRDLAELYQVQTRVLNQAVRRHLERFPDDFMFNLTRDEIMNLSQFVIGSGIKHAPSVFAFTDYGILMLSSVLRSPRAIAVNIQIMRTFVRLQETVAAHKELADRLAELERRMGKKDNEIIALFNAIRKLMEPLPEKPKRKIGFIVDRE
jgi:hypothetical protein